MTRVESLALSIHNSRRLVRRVCNVSIIFGSSSSFPVCCVSVRPCCFLRSFLSYACLGGRSWSGLKARWFVERGGIVVERKTRPGNEWLSMIYYEINTRLDRDSDGGRMANNR